MAQIIVTASGWCRADPEEIRFQLTSVIEGEEEFITGTEWLKLPEHDDTAICRDDYILESVRTAFKHSFSGVYDLIGVEVKDE